MPRLPLPPFTVETATQKVRVAEDAWNTRDPERVALAYTKDSPWRNRAEFFQGRSAIIQFLQRKWARELDYRLIKELWPSPGIASRCASSTNGTTIPGTGVAHTAMNNGNSTRMA
jgi:nuclear transport factor 2 (NTF2) superfamily protein